MLVTKKSAYPTTQTAIAWVMKCACSELSGLSVFAFSGNGCCARSNLGGADGSAAATLALGATAPFASAASMQNLRIGLSRFATAALGVVGMAAFASVAMPTKGSRRRRGVAGGRIDFKFTRCSSLAAFSFRPL